MSFSKKVSLFNEVKKVSLFSEVKKIRTVTCSDSQYANLYNNVGLPITNILNAFVDGSDQLNTLVNYDNYAQLADLLYVSKIPSNKYYENYRRIMIDSVEGAKHCNNRITEQTNMYNNLLADYNKLLSNKSVSGPILETSASMDTVATIKPEILKYFSMGYKLVNDDGQLIPIDMEVLAQIRKDLLIEESENI